ncbi:MAG: SH3 domain-containing protein [Chloroflexi bacterium]|nr:SH3 domain-containing protein [Chloroflexota bacterium]
MTQDPKKLPNWLRGKKKAEAPPPQQTPPPKDVPPPVEPPEASAPDDDSALPPWLRKDAPPPPPTPSKVRRLAPPPPEQPGGVPPWLAGMEEEPKAYKIGGTELSEEYLKGGDELPDTLDSEMTYDSWMADQLESKREKDIEEEVPDLLSSITPDDSLSRPEGKQTGQLPDWFLGLEELDEAETPDWFNADEQTTKAAGDTMPPWINDMVEQQPEPEPIDEIGSFFDSLGSSDAVEEETPEIDWFNHPEVDDEDFQDDPDNIPGVPTDDFFAQLVSGNRSTPTPQTPARAPEPPPRPPADVRPPPRQEIELPDIDDLDEFIEDEPEARPAVEIPQNELDAFFDNVAAGRETSPVDDIEDPDLEWIVPSEPAAEALPEEPEIEFEPEPPSAAQEEDTMSWLNQLQNIVSSASRPTEPPPEETVTLGTLDTWDAPPEENRAEADDFAWPEADVVETPPPEDTQETEWFSAITPDDAAADEEQPPEALTPPAPRTSLLSSRLNQAQEPAADNEDELPEDFFGQSTSTDASDEESLIPEEELKSGWMSDDLFKEYDAETAGTTETPADSADDDDFFGRLQADAEANVLGDDEGLSQWAEAENALADDDFLSSLDFEQTDAAPNNPPGGWEHEPPRVTAPLNSDFLNSLGIDEQQSSDAQRDLDGQQDNLPASDDEPLDDDFFSSLNADVPPAASEEDSTGAWGVEDSIEEPLDDDFFSSLNANESPAASEEDATGAWDVEDSIEEPLDDDFFSSLNADMPPAASEEDATGAWGVEDSIEESLDDDLFTTPSANIAQEEDALGQWSAQQSEIEPSDDDDLFETVDEDAAQTDEDTEGLWGVQPSEAERREQDFYALLGMSDEDQQEVAATQNDLYDPWAEQPQDEDASTDEDDFLAVFGESAADDDQSAAQNESFGQWDAEQSETELPQDDDLFGSLSMGDEADDQSAAQNESFGQWDAEQSETELPQDDDLFGSLSLSDEEDDQPSAENESFGQWDAEQSETELPQEDDFLASLSMGDEADDQSAAQNESFGQWDAEQSETELPQEDDLFASLSMNDEEDDQPAAQDEPFGQWDAEQSETELPQEEDRFATRNVKGEFGDQTDSDEDDLFGSWSAQATEEALQEDDFFARLGMNDNDDEEMPSSAAPEADSYGQWQTEDEAGSAEFLNALGLNEDEDDLPYDAQSQWGDVQGDPAEQEDTFLSSLGFQEDENAALPSGDDMFAQWDEQAQPEAAPLDNDFFASLDPNQPPQPEPDPYAQWDNNNEAELPPSEDFFSAIGMLSEADAPVEPAPTWDGQEAPSEEDFFTSLGMLNDDDNQQPTQPMPGNKNEPQSYGDVDSYLASLNVGEPDITPTTDDLFSESDNMDIDALFAQPMMRDKPAADAPVGDQLPGANEDWLNQLQASVGEVSASAIVRQKEDRPVEELSDRLKKLRQRAEQMSDEAPAQESSSLTEMLPDGGSSLSAAPFIDVEPTSIQGVVLTPEQQSRVDILKNLVPADTRGETRLSAIDATYDSPFMTDLEDSEESIVRPTQTVEAPARPRTRRRTRQRIRLERVLVAAVIALAVIVPFTIRGFRVGDLPPSRFAAGSSEQTAFSQINSLKAGDLVLVGLEYGPTSAAELDGMTTALLRHILMKAAYPVIISGNPLTILRSQDLMASINADSDFMRRIRANQPLSANHDYYIIRYLPGSVIGLRAFSQDTANLILSDVQGQATGLIVRSMQDFALVTVVTDRAEDLRAYAEQIAPLTRAPLISAVSYGAAPLAEPYIHTMGGGLLVGYRDAYTYNDALASVAARSLSQQAERIIPTEIPTTAPSSADGGAEATPEATDEFGRPTTQSAIGTATVIARQAVNMRSGPGTNNAVVAAVPSGSVLTVLELSDDQAWAHVVLDNGQDGWISAALLALNIKQSLRERPESHAKRQQIEPDNPTETPAAQTRAPATQNSAVTAEASAGTETVIAPTSTPRPTATLEPTQEVTAEVVVSVPPPPPSLGYRDERWYAMNLGIIASTLVITFGAVINILRGLLRRGRSS